MRIGRRTWRSTSGGSLKVPAELAAARSEDDVEGEYFEGKDNGKGKNERAGRGRRFSAL